MPSCLRHFWGTAICQHPSIISIPTGDVFDNPQKLQILGEAASPDSGVVGILRMLPIPKIYWQARKLNESIAEPSLSQLLASRMRRSLYRRSSKDRLTP